MPGAVEDDCGAGRGDFDRQKGWQIPLGGGGGENLTGRRSESDWKEGRERVVSPYRRFNKF